MLIAAVAAIGVVALRLHAWQAVPLHQSAAERAVAWMLLISDSAPYTGELVDMAEAALGSRLAYVEVGGELAFLGAPAAPGQPWPVTGGEVYAVKAVWLGYNGTVNPVEVVVGAEP